MLPGVSASIAGHLQIMAAVLLFSTGGAAIKLSAFQLINLIINRVKK